MNNFNPKKDTDIQYIKKILINYFGNERFIFSRKITLLGYRYKIEFKPYGYYFIYYKENNLLFCKSFFPKWTNNNTIKTADSFETELIAWVTSIKRIFSRKKSINMSISEGAERRKDFENKSKNI